jgi:hypothetical protein
MVTLAMLRSQATLWQINESTRDAFTTCFVQQFRAAQPDPVTIGSSSFAHD